MYSSYYLRAHSTDSFDDKERSLITVDYQHHHIKSADSLELEQKLDGTSIKVESFIPKNDSFHLDIASFDSSSFDFEQCYEENMGLPVGKVSPGIVPTSFVGDAAGIESRSQSTRINAFDEPGFVMDLLRY